MNEPSGEYWEAFPISKGRALIDARVVPPEKEKPAAYTDGMYVESPNDTCKWFYVTGEVKFYCKDPFLNNNWALGLLGGFNYDFSVVDSWQILKTNYCNSEWTSGKAKATESEPDFWSLPAIEGPATHGMAFSWDCCNGGESHAFYWWPSNPAFGTHKGLGASNCMHPSRRLNTYALRKGKNYVHRYDTQTLIAEEQNWNMCEWDSYVDRHDASLHRDLLRAITG